MVTGIICDEKTVSFLLDGATEKKIHIKAYSPAVGENILLGECDAEVCGDSFMLDRHEFSRDGAYLRYETDEGGVKYVSHVNPKYDFPYPDVGTKKGLQIVDTADAIELGVRHAALNVAINDIMRRYPGEETDEFVFDGKTYYINRDAVKIQDRRIKELTEAGVLITLILLCGKKWGGIIPDNMKELLLHPDYDDEGTLAAFNTVTDEGVRYYMAFVAYLCERYTRPDKKYGQAYGLIISNEVQSQWVWGNAGNKTVSEFARDYTTALRLACLVGCSYYGHMRTYISLDHFWGKSMDPAQPTKYYGAKELLSCINSICKDEGNFYWNIAHHPYPQDLRYPDFWNDETATDDENTHRITFKNLHVLAEFLYKEENLFDGVRRRVILSEQGFNSNWTPESEILQATAYGRAYHEVMKIPEIDSFILHAHHDNKYEFGLNLGLWRRHKDDNTMEAPKPAYYLFKVIDQKDETGKFVWERF